MVFGVSLKTAAQNTDSLKGYLENVDALDLKRIQTKFIQSTQNPDQKELAQTYLIWAGYLNESGKYDSAKVLYKYAVELFEIVNAKSQLANAKMELADFLINEDNYAESLKLNHEAYDLYVTLGDSLNIYYSLAAIGINHDYMGDHDLAITFYRECIDIANAIGRDIGVASMYHNLGGIYSDEKNFQLALDYYDKSRKIAENMKNWSLVASNYQGLYLTYQRMELKSESFVNLKNAYKYALLSEVKKQIGFAYQGHGSYFLDIGNYDSSIYYSKKALALAQSLNNGQITSNAYSNLQQAYYKIGDYKQAYDFYAKEVAMDDSVYTIENSQLIESIKTQFETEKKERELVEKNLQLQTADYNLKRQSFYQTLLIIALVFLFIVVFLVYRGYVLRKKANDQLTQKNTEIASQNEKIKGINEMKSRWFINVAHELRTPLTLIKGPIHKILNTEELTPDMEEDLELVYKNTQNLVKLVNEILDLSKLEDGEMALNKQIVNINELGKQVISIFTTKAKDQGVKIIWEDAATPFMNVDGNKISKIIINLISNALRFTDPGGSINIRTIINDQIKLTVKDTGQGIEQEDLPHIFDRFYQAPSSKNAGGTGVGLALSREIAILHGGSLEVQSEFLKGTTFTLYLPIHIIAQAPETIETTQVETALQDNFVPIDILSRLSDKPILLIVEDNSDMRKYVSGLLKPYFEVRQAINGLEGLKILEKDKVKIIISDMMMPEMDGLAFSKKVKATPEWNKIPFIHLTALSDDATKKEALRIGIDDYLQKPFDPEELIIRLQNLYQNAAFRMEEEPDKEESISFDDKLLKKLRDEVMDRISDSNFNVLSLADCAAMSERQIYRYLKNATGLTPLQFIQEIKLNKAMELAQKRVYLSSNELAAAVGFQYSPYFSTLFEKRFGKKPSAYLKAG
ncbi:MAG: signal transduction histidine kinase/DNA-binding response OmpR family regulator [Cyclobacteriaceae bacterium]